MTIRDPILSNLWAEFVNKNRCIGVRLVSRKLKALNFDNFDNSHNSFLRPEYFIDFVCERWIPCQALTSVLCLHYRPGTVHCSTKDVYTSEITFLALHPWCEWSIQNNMRSVHDEEHSTRLKIYIFLFAK